MSFVVVTELDHIAYVKLHRPEVRNAFNSQMITDITEVFLQLEKRSDLRAVVLEGEGKVFCAGGDLNWMQEMVNFNQEQNIQDSLKLFSMFEAIAHCTLPVIGLVHGAAFGGALGLISACDEVIAEEDTKFCFSEVKLGIAPAVISAFVNRKAVSGKVRPLMLSAVVFNAHIAQQAGLVTEVVPVGEGHRFLQKVLHNYQQVGAQAARATKKLLNQLDSLSWAEQKNTTAKLIADLRAGAEGQEGLRAFLEKREPTWRKL